MVINKQHHWDLYLYSFFYHKMGHDHEKITKFLTSRSKYGVSNDSHFTLQGFKLTFIVDGTYKFHN